MSASRRDVPKLPRRLLKIHIEAADLAHVLSTDGDHFSTVRARRFLFRTKIGVKVGGRWGCILEDLLGLPKIGPLLASRLDEATINDLLGKQKRQKRSRQTHIGGKGIEG